MELLQTWLDYCNVPILTALLLGLFTAVNPCQLVTNITAIGFIGKNLPSKTSVFLYGMIYTLGRVLTYTSLGALLIYMLHSGLDTLHLQSAVSQWGERLLAPVLLAIGILMLLDNHLHTCRWGKNVTDRAEWLRGAWGSMLLGMVFAMAFCPASAFMFFGILIPLSATTAGGYTLPAVYAIATGLPVVAVSWIIAHSMTSISGIYSKIQVFQQRLNRLVALLFILAGLYFIHVYFE